MQLQINIQHKKYTNILLFNDITKANPDFHQDSPLVEHSGLEPLTSTLPVSRSSQMS